MYNFVGSSPPSDEWLQKKAKPLAVWAHKVQEALLWLKVHNPLYVDIEINYNVLNSLPKNSLLPFHIEHVLPNKDGDALTSRYDVTLSSSALGEQHVPIPPDAEIAFQKLVISDIDSHASSNELRAAALTHMQNKGHYLKFPHDVHPENEYINPKLFPKIYPTLFPFGVGGFKDHSCKEPISLKQHVKAFVETCRS